MLPRLLRTWRAFALTVAAGTLVLAGAMYWMGGGIFQALDVGREAFFYLALLSALIVLPIAFMLRVMWHSETPPSEQESTETDGHRYEAP